MNCSDAQNQMGFTGMQGQDNLSNVLSHNFTPQTGGGTGDGVTQLLGPYASSGGTTTQQIPGTSQQVPGTTNQITRITPTTEPQAMTLTSLQYLNAALRTQIGRKVTIDFLIGTNTLVDKTGTLLAVGANYLIINEIETDDLLFCDFFTIKFVKVYG